MCGITEGVGDTMVALPSNMQLLVRCANCRKCLSSDQADGSYLCDACHIQHHKTETLLCQLERHNVAEDEHYEYIERDPHAVRSIGEADDTCVVCRKFISTKPRYQCRQKHSMCVQCAQKVYRCFECNSYVDANVKYCCNYWGKGCSFRGDYPETEQHQTDCIWRDFACPFAERCQWMGAIDRIHQHLHALHTTETHACHQITRAIGLWDDSWVMVAHGELFKCYMWTNDNCIEWIARYIGSQAGAKDYNYTVTLSNKFGLKVKFINACLGWNSFSLEKVITVQLDKLTYNHKTIEFTFEINRRVEN